LNDKKEQAIAQALMTVFSNKLGQVGIHARDLRQLVYEELANRIMPLGSIDWTSKQVAQIYNSKMLNHAPKALISRSGNGGGTLIFGKYAREILEISMQALMQPRDSVEEQKQ